MSGLGWPFEMRRPLPELWPLHTTRNTGPPVYEPDDFAWITEPTRKCDSDSCYNWFDIDRKTCPLCCTARNPRKRGK